MFARLREPNILLGTLISSNVTIMSGILLLFVLLLSGLLVRSLLEKSKNGRVFSLKIFGLQCQPVSG